VIDRYVSPEELRRLMSSLVVVIGGIMIPVLFALIIVPGLRNANKPPAAAPVAAPVGETGWLDPTEVTPMKGYQTAPIDPNTVMTASPQLLERGKALFAQHCISCHGDAGGGDGPAAMGLQPPPRNFTRREGWKNGYELAEIFKTLKQGIAGGGMNSFDYLRADDRMALAHFVQSLGAFDHGEDDPAELDALAKQFASAGEKIPGRIPVSLAIAKLVHETVPIAPIPAGDAGGLIARAIADGRRAAITLSGSAVWRDDPAALARIAVTGAPGNGFSVTAATFDARQWEALRGELLRMVAP
jgi:high-affinity iron transporter